MKCIVGAENIQDLVTNTNNGYSHKCLLSKMFYIFFVL